MTCPRVVFSAGPRLAADPLSRTSPRRKASKAPRGDALSPYERKREANMAANAARMKALGVDKAASALKPTSKTSAAPARRKRVENAENAAAPSRRSSRARAEVSYKEPTMREFEEAFAVDTSAEDARAARKSQLAKASRSGYAPPETNKFPFAPSLDVDDGAPRDAKTGKLVFVDHPEFTPNLTPKQVIQAGSWGGVYFNPRGGKAGIKSRDVNVTHAEFPKDWFAGLKPDLYRARRYDASRNKYRVKAGQDQAFWEEHGWIIDQDPRGWFQWYCRFFLGRRSADDARQISRWTGVAGAKGRWKTALCKKCVYANKRFDDQTVSPVIRQTMLHWAYEITEQDVKDVMKRM